MPNESKKVLKGKYRKKKRKKIKGKYKKESRKKAVEKKPTKYRMFTKEQMEKLRDTIPKETDSSD